MRLTVRQRDVMEHIALGKPNKQIARDMNLSLGTIKVHTQMAYRALGARNRTEAAIAYLKAAA